jgi:hypothetical protein
MVLIKKIKYLKIFFSFLLFSGFFLGGRVTNFYIYYSKRKGSFVSIEFYFIMQLTCTVIFNEDEIIYYKL